MQQPAGWQAWFTLALTASLIVAMARGRAPDLVLLGGLSLLLALGVVAPADAFAGFSNEGVLAVAALFVVAAGIRETGALDWIARSWLGRPRSTLRAQLRMTLPVAALSAFVNNTPIVAVSAPLVAEWGRRIGISPSKLLIPLSYATILGGCCTLIGTSTNLLVAGFARREGLEIGLFEIAWVGLPALLAGLTYLLVASPWLLPEGRQDPVASTSARDYGVTMGVAPGSPIVGRSIEAADLRRLPGLFLAEIRRDGEILPAVEPGTVLRGGDQLLFVGIVAGVTDLRRIRGLVPLADEAAEEPRVTAGGGARLFEAVIAFGSDLVGRSVRDSRFRTRYQAAVLAIHRAGSRLEARLGDVVLEPGDTLLIEARPGFLERYGHDRDFALVAEVAGSGVPRHERAGLAAAILAALVLSHVLLDVPLLTAALLAAGGLVAARCLSGAEAVRAVDLRVMLAIAASFGIGLALERTGAAQSLSRWLLEPVAPLGPLALLAAIYVATAILTEVITNNAAAVLMFPVATAAAEATGLELRPVAFTLMMAASASFSTPIGYQTNLMVWGPGGYRFSDFVRIGLPLQLWLAIVTVGVVGWRWL